MKPPNPDEIEITVFGPGYGECIVIHAGSGKWFIVDSCLDMTGLPASIVHLNSLGVKPKFQSFSAQKVRSPPVFRAPTDVRGRMA